MLEQGWEPKKVGNLYRVRIKADKENFLDWDRPLDDQKHLNLKEIIDDLLVDSEGVFEKPIQNPGRLTGNELYEYLIAYYDSPEGKAASERLSEAGIPGIKYLDAGQRGRKLNPELAIADRQRRFGDYADNMPKN